MAIAELPNKIFKLAVLENSIKKRIGLDPGSQSSFVWNFSPQTRPFWIEIYKGRFNRYFLDKHEDSAE